MSEPFWYAGIWLCIYSLVVIANLIGVTSLIRPGWWWIGLLTTLGGYALVYVNIIGNWNIPTNDWTYPNLLFWLTSIGVFCGHLRVSLRTPLPREWAWLRWVTVGTVAVLGMLVCYKVTLPRIISSESAMLRLGNDNDPNIKMMRRIEFLNRLISAVAAAAGCGTMAMYLIKRMNRKPRRGMTAPAHVGTVQVECPLCQTRQPLPIGAGACIECGLRFSIKLDEPRCSQCGYLLYRLKCDRCPECGVAIGTT